MFPAVFEWVYIVYELYPFSSDEENQRSLKLIWWQRENTSLVSKEKKKKTENKTKERVQMQHRELSHSKGALSSHYIENL